MNNIELTHEEMIKLISLCLLDNMFNFEISYTNYTLKLQFFDPALLDKKWII
jgi:hypothetical protein